MQNIVIEKIIRSRIINEPDRPVIAHVKISSSDSGSMWINGLYDKYKIKFYITKDKPLSDLILCNDVPEDYEDNHIDKRIKTFCGVKLYDTYDDVVRSFEESNNEEVINLIRFVLYMLKEKDKSLSNFFDKAIGQFICDIDIPDI